VAFFNQTRNAGTATMVRIQSSNCQRKQRQAQPVQGEPDCCGQCARLRMRTFDPKAYHNDAIEDRHGDESSSGLIRWVVMDDWQTS